MNIRRTFPVAAGLVLALTLSSLAVAQTPVPGFSKAFSPATIGPGSVSLLTFTITNNTANPVENLAFTDNLPAGVTIASPAGASHTCGTGVLSAPDGGGTIALSGGQVPGVGSCSVRVHVTASAAGTYSNLSGDLTSDAGNSGSASADLTVAVDRPGFAKSFSPPVVAFGGRSTLTLTIDNTANPANATRLEFVDNLPPGMTIASPSNKSTTCAGGTLTAPAGGTSISLGFPQTVLNGPLVTAGASCEVRVDVVGGATGALVNVSGELTSSNQFGSSPRTSGRAIASLTVTNDRVALIKRFVDDPVAPGTPVTVEFTVLNLDRGLVATDISFSDDLDAALAGLVAAGLPADDVCGAGSQLAGTDTLTLTGGTLDPETSCTFTATLEVPLGAVPGSYLNTTSNVTATVGNDAVVGAPASDNLFVAPLPILVKEFLDATTQTADPVDPVPVGSGQDVLLRFTITNGSPNQAATDIAFVDELTTFLGSPINAVLPGADPCGAGSSLSLGSVGLGQGLLFEDGILAAGGSCSFDVVLTLGADQAPGLYVNTTEEITATVGGQTYSGRPARDSFLVVAPPALLKVFVDDPVAPGDTVTLRFTLTYDLDGDGVVDFDIVEAAGGIGFSDNLEATLPGLAPVGPLPSFPCGPSSSLTFASGSLTLAGGELDPGADPPDLSCTFDVPLSVPATASAGNYPNTTSGVQATVAGLATVGSAASDTLRVAGLTLTKEFIDDPVIAGGNVTLRFTIANISPVENATDIFFRDDLGDLVSDGAGNGLDLVATGLPLAGVCGAGSTLAGTAGNTFLTFQDGLLTAGSSCTFDVTLQVPVATAAGTYPNATQDFSATFGGTLVAFDNAFDDLTVETDFLDLAKEFLDDPAVPGGEVTLRFTLTNLDAVQAASEIAFSDDLDAALEGLASISGTLADVCGAGSEISGTGLLAFTGGSLPAGGSCFFDVTLTVPAGAALGSVAVNTTSEVTGTIGGFGVTGDPASDELAIAFVEFSKSFDDFVEAGGTVSLTFEIRNVSATTSLTGLSFSDDLDPLDPVLAGGVQLTGLTAIGLPASNVCGLGSQIDGTDLLTLTDGSLAPGGSCTFSVDLQVPGTAEPDDYLNVTSELRIDGGAVAAQPASAELTVIEVGDDDGDGVLNAFDACPGTVIPESVPTVRLEVNRFALVDSDLEFETRRPPGPGPRLSFDTTDTAGCSCEQIIAALGLGEGHTMFGCSISAMRDWIAIVSGTPLEQLGQFGRANLQSEPPLETESDAATAPSLTILVEGPGGVVSSPAVDLGNGRRMMGINCTSGARCTKKFPPGQMVKLQARTDGEPFAFVGWSGSCSGTDPVLEVTVDRALTCTAVFRQIDE